MRRGCVCVCVWFFFCVRSMRVSVCLRMWACVCVCVSHLLLFFIFFIFVHTGDGQSNWSNKCCCEYKRLEEPPPLPPLPLNVLFSLWTFWYCYIFTSVVLAFVIRYWFQVRFIIESEIYKYSYEQCNAVGRSLQTVWIFISCFLVCMCKNQIGKALVEYNLRFADYLKAFHNYGITAHIRP